MVSMEKALSCLPNCASVTVAGFALSLWVSARVYWTSHVSLKLLYSGSYSVCNAELRAVGRRMSLLQRDRRGRPICSAESDMKKFQCSCPLERMRLERWQLGKWYTKRDSLSLVPPTWTTQRSGMSASAIWRKSRGKANWLRLVFRSWWPRQHE